MKTERLVFEEGPGGDAALERAAALLRAGKLVAFPTETVYGLGALALDPAAVRRIFAAKGRPPTNPLIVHVGSVEQARQVVASWPPVASRLAEAFWPGPLTLVLPKAEAVPPEVSAGLPSVGVRLPAHPLAHELLRRVGAPLAAPSANRYTAVSPTTARHVEKSLDGRIDAILDGGPTGVGIESTVVQIVGDAVRILRPGAISRADLEEVARVEEGGAPEVAEGALPSPGLARRHYAPEVEVRLVYPLELREATLDATEEVGVIALQPRPFLSGARWIELPADPALYAQQLYAALHAMEDVGVEVLLIEVPPPGVEWEGVRDRLERAAAGKGGGKR